MKLSFLFADVPLSKTIFKVDGVIDKKSYPNVKLFTSETVTITNALSLFNTIKAHAEDPRGPALLSGPLNRTLTNESRAGSTTSLGNRQLLLLDLDAARFNNPEEFMKNAGLEDISYTVQYSASQGLSKTLSCHIFILLEKAIPAPQLKTWLMWLNLRNDALKGALTLCNAGHALHYSVDITVCQNDKLIYIATPTFEGMKDPWKEPRIQFVSKTLDKLPIARLAQCALDALKVDARKIRDTLRKAQGLAPITAKESNYGEYVVQKGAGQVTITGMRDERGFRYFNLNGGDSWGYFHPENNFELLHNFKGEPFLFIKEVTPDYYAEQMGLRDQQHSIQHNDGDTVMIFINKHTAEYKKLKYLNGELEITPAKNETQLAHFMKENRVQMPSFIQEWDLKFNPHSDVVIDREARTINTFKPSIYMDPANQKKGSWPNIQLFFESAVGKGEVYDFVLNWLAVIFQHKIKTQTSQIWHGIQGTGKGKIIERIIRPIFGDNNVVVLKASALNEQFNAHFEHALIAFIDEIEADMFTNQSSMERDLRNAITDDIIDIRRMRTDRYTVKSYINFIFSSNKPKPVSIPPHDRRANVGQFQPNRFNPTDEQYDAVPDELAAFAYFLQHHKADIKLARSVLDTADRREIQLISMNSIDELSDGLLNGNFEVIASAMPDERLMNESGIIDPVASAFINIVKRCSLEKESKLTRDELAVIFQHCIGHVPEGKNKFTSYLRHHGLHTRQLKSNGLKTYGITVNWKTHDFSYEKTPLRRVK